MAWWGRNASAVNAAPVIEDSASVHTSAAIGDAGAERVPVRTAAGPVSGRREGDLAVFRGIPFAAPPAGALRFRAPQPPEPWHEPLDTVEFGPACPQTYSDLELPAGSPMSEDCLTLNVWTPDTTGTAPVIVFIHGGGFTAGTSANAWYDGADLSRNGVVVVTVQYRLGPFGWLDLSSLGPEYASSANNGLRDQMAALQWVRDNIAAFGGDAANVTISGESAGAISLSALLGAPSADGLYDRLILQSGTAGTVASAEWAAGVADEFVRGARVDSPEDLLGLDSEAMLRAAERLYASEFSDTAFHPVVDGDLIPEPPAHRIAREDGPRPPVIIGTTLDEARYWLYLVPAFGRLPAVYFRPWLRALVGARADEVVAAYRRERPGYSAAQIGMALVGDVAFRMPAVRMAEALSAAGAPVRMYLATVPAIDLGGILGSPHAVELPFVFGTTGAAADFVGDTSETRALSERVQRLWVSFARGTQIRSDDVVWPLYDAAERRTLMLDAQPRIDSDPYAATRRVWGDIRFDGTRPGLDGLTPMSYEGTRELDPRVIAAVIGWKRIGLGILAAAAAVGVIMGVCRRSS